VKFIGTWRNAVTEYCHGYQAILNDKTRAFAVGIGLVVHKVNRVQ
jgi:hypothetical protein